MQEVVDLICWRTILLLSKTSQGAASSQMCLGGGSGGGEPQPTPLARGPGFLPLSWEPTSLFADTPGNRLQMAKQSCYVLFHGGSL